MTGPMLSLAARLDSLFGEPTMAQNRKSSICSVPGAALRPACCRLMMPSIRGSHVKDALAKDARADNSDLALDAAVAASS